MEWKRRSESFSLKHLLRLKLLKTLPSLVVDGLSLDVLLGSNRMKAVSACLDIHRLTIVVHKKNLKYKKPPSPSEDFVRVGF